MAAMAAMGLQDLLQTLPQSLTNLLVMTFPINFWMHCYALGVAPLVYADMKDEVIASVGWALVILIVCIVWRCLCIAILATCSDKMIVCLLERIEKIFHTCFFSYLVADCVSVAYLERHVYDVWMPPLKFGRTSSTSAASSWRRCFFRCWSGMLLPASQSSLQLFGKR